MSDENYRYCHSCGFPITDSTQKFCTNCGSALMDSDVSETTAQMALPMKWYKFLIYFALFVSAILSFISGLDCLTGNIFSTYGWSANEAYTEYEGLKPLLTAMGTVSIIYGMYQLATRFCLAKKMKIGPKLVIMMYIISPTISMVFEIAAASFISSHTGQSLSQSGLSVMGIVFNLAVGAAIAYANKIYFDRRSALFVN